MENSIKAHLCKSIRSCGLRKEETLELVNTIEKWYDSCGPEWVVARLKDYVQWYETYLAGDPQPPPWVAHNRSKLPVGIFGYVFKQRNPARALAVLSGHTVFKSRKITPNQKEKFLDGLSAKGQRTKPEILAEFPLGKRVRLPKLRVTPPSFDAISGFSIPISSEEGKVFIDSPEARILAYCDSWQNVPLPTLRLLRRERALEQVPPALLEEGGVDGLFAIYPSQESEAGFIGCIQEPSMKARWIANPNRISQAYMEPFGSHLYQILKSLPTDCTFNQESGITWVQEQLKGNVTLAGADLSSATDLLDRELCMEVISRHYLGRPLKEEGWTDPTEITYRSHIQHFMDIASMEWVFPTGGTVKWAQGQPLGTYPSFAILGLTNNLLGEVACSKAGIPKDSFRVIGDDIILDVRAMSHYIELVEAFGGKINHQKSLTSSRCAEFAGRVILPDRSMNKTVKFKEVSDNSFMEIISSLGDQAKGLLRPRQRKQYDIFKYVPGIVVDGPFPKQSFGIPLELRYIWYLLHSGLCKERVVPDKDKYDSFQFGMKIYYTLAEKGRASEFELSVPLSFADDFQSSLASAVVKKGDPRLKNGKSLLQVLEEITSSERFQSLQDYMLDLKSQELKHSRSQGPSL